MARTQINGYNTRTSIIPETTYGTNPATGSQELFVQSFNIEHDRNQTPLNFLTKGSQADVKQGNESTNLTISGPIPRSSIAFHALMNRFFSKQTTTGAGPYTHPYTFPYLQIPGSFTFEGIPEGENSSTKAVQVYGCVPQRLRVSAQAGELPTYELFCLGRQLANATGPATAPSGAVDSSVYSAGDMDLSSLPATAGDGLLFTDTSSNGYYVLPVAYEIEINAGLDEDAYTLDTTYRRQIQRGANMEVTGTVSFLYETGESWDSHDLISQIRQGTHFTTQWRLVAGGGGAQTQFQIDLGTGTAGAVVFDESAAAPTPDGPGRMIVEAPFSVNCVEDNLALTIVNAMNGTTVDV